MHRLFVKLFGQNDFDATACQNFSAMPQSCIQVVSHAITHRLHIDKARGIETVEVQLQRFTFNDVSAFCGHRDVRNGHLRLALQIEPRELKRSPQICTKENRRTYNAQLFALDSTGNWKQQGRIVLIDIGAVFAQLRLLWLVHTAPFSRRRKTQRLTSDSESS